MRPLVVVAAAEDVEGALLGPHRDARRARSLALQRPMEALEAAVLLRLAGPDPVRHDAETDPPDRKSRQAADTGRRERRAVVAADAGGQAVLAERRLEHLARPALVGVRQDLAAQKVAAVTVDESQRVTELAVGRAE